MSLRRGGLGFVVAAVAGVAACSSGGGGNGGGGGGGDSSSSGAASSSSGYSSSSGAASSSSGHSSSSGAASSSSGHSSSSGASSSSSGSSSSGSVQGGWLRTEGNKILKPDGTRFHGRGVNIFDTRDAGACGWAAPIIDEWIRRVDVLIDTWHVNFFRLDLTSWASNQVGGYTVVQWQDVTQSAAYLADVKKLVDHIGTKSGVYVMITLFSHPSQDANELPTDATQAVYTKLATTFLNSPQVLYGITNEPHDTTDAAVWTAMNKAVTTYRNAEPTAGPHHLVAVQGTQGYARELAYYVDHPITAGGGANVVYETHVYNPVADWQTQFIAPAATLPVIIGEYGPDGTYMKTIAEAQALQQKAEDLEIPYIGWSFSSQNGPTMLVGSDNDECATTNWTITPSDWGKAIVSRLANPW